MQRVGLGIGLATLALAPVGAGATGHSALAMLAFAGVFFLANAVIRPGAVRLDDLGATALQLVTASAFAALLVGFGQTLRALVQIEAQVALGGWVILAAWGAVLARLVWRRSMGDSATQNAETALRVIHETGPKLRGKKKERPAHLKPVPDSAPAKDDPAPKTVTPFRPDPALAGALQRLNELPENGATDAELARALATVSGSAPLGSVFAALSTRAPNTERDRRALVLHTTDPWVAERRNGKHEPASAFEVVVAAADAVALNDFATRSFALLDELPETRIDMPAVARLLEIADQIEGDLETESELLVALAHKIEDLALEAEHDHDG
ncbi:MAG: hypothetical protein AAGB05_10250 [Pseudomonadota bacterium]